MTTPQKKLPKWDFAGECVLVSGGARGIGAGMVEQFARCGADVIFGDSDKIGSDQLVEKMAAERLTVHAVEADFIQPGAWPLLRVKAEQLGFAPSLVVANVGIGLEKPKGQHECSLEDFDRLFNANIKSAWIAAREFGPVLARRPGSSFLLTGTVMTHFGTAGHTLYATSKSALSGLLRSLCVEFGPQGLRVNMIVPGYIINDPPPLYRSKVPRALWREFHARFGAEVAAGNQPAQPLAFWGQSEDIAQAACFLHSPAARYITGVELPVDGGLLCQSPIRESSGNESWAWTDDMSRWLQERGTTS